MDAGSGLKIARSVPHGHVAAMWAMAQRLGLPGCSAPMGRLRDLAWGLIVSRVVAPASKLATLAAPGLMSPWVRTWAWSGSTDDVYAAADYPRIIWLQRIWPRSVPHRDGVVLPVVVVDDRD